ncbi:hypothetical protein SCUCBS95973_000316 [Sporothrix curviconia]|uniref:Uncharacterized protein n=1 Tax=Sporothrix curviconia TaxID=1260050 RepID=A0ABP0AP69_9PEZI
MVELSMKLTFGFELMSSSAETSNSRVVREVGLILEDLAEDGEDPAALPSNDEIRSWPDANRESDGSWLNINFEDFERELDGVHAQDMPALGNEPTSKSGFGDSNVQTDLRRIVSQFQAFLNDTDAGIEGASLDEMDKDNDDDNAEDHEDSENSSDDGEDGDERDGVSFDEEEFSCLLREAMGLPPSDTATAGPQTKSTSGREVDTSTVNHSPTEYDKDGMDEEEEGILKLAAQFEAELRAHGALRLNTPKSGKKVASSASETITADTETRDDTIDPDTESDDEEEVDVDFNLAKNLLESFKGQEGMSGPAGNILDDDEEEKLGT